MLRGGRVEGMMRWEIEDLICVLDRARAFLVDLSICLSVYLLLR